MVDQDQALVVVAGLGEVGRPLKNILSRTFTCTGIDVDPVPIDDPVSVPHICYPFQIGSFNAVTADYIRRRVLHSPSSIAVCPRERRERSRS